VWKKKNCELLVTDLPGKMTALAASGRRIIDDMNKLNKAA
jgi:hypothetical protein